MSKSLMAQLLRELRTFGAVPFCERDDAEAFADYCEAQQVEVAVWEDAHGNISAEMVK